MRIGSLCLALIGAASAALGTGCLASCPQLCAEEARYIDGCLEHWEGLWPDLGYDGIQDVDEVVDNVQRNAGDVITGGPAQEFTERCSARFKAAQYFGTLEQGREVRVSCAENLALLANTPGCTGYAPAGLGNSTLDPTPDGDNGVVPRP